MLFGSQQAFGLEIIATPLKDPFGPNDWIEIELEIDGYYGGEVEWEAILPDGSLESGKLESFKTSNKLHTILRDAFDNQFGNWIITYKYNGINKTISTEVEPLTVEIRTDKESYYPGDTGTAYLKTNHHNPIASQAESYRIEIQNDKGETPLHSDYVYVKAYQTMTVHTFSINDLVKYNPPGTYNIVVQYYNSVFEYPFYLGDAISFVSIFLGTDKSSYLPGETVELSIVTSKVLNADPVLMITPPAGATITKTFPIDSQSTRLILDDISTTMPGNYKFRLDYGGFQNTGEFIVEETNSSFDLKDSLEIPDWIRNAASWWSDDQITDEDFASGIEYLIEQSIIKIPNLSDSGERIERKIPDWVKNNAKWWSEGKISDVDFASGIEFLVKNGIIQV
ncbi:MAG: hypothetical protein ACE5RT_03405 [Nitrosopumilaceae archaeon]